MTDTLSKKEKLKLVKIAVRHITPIAKKHNITNVTTLTALSEAFHAGIQFLYEEQSKVGEKTLHSKVLKED